ncbi:hypothetical protein K488DRAFT_24099, partial [Vararia minispora EC-137]
AKHRVWAHIYDTCAARGAQYFVLTNYTQWVFGAFSPGLTRAWVCATPYFDDRDPGVLELLLYWIATAL